MDGRADYTLRSGHFVELPADVLREVAQGRDLGLIVTANDRLRRQWRRALEHHSQQHHQAWQTPNVRSIEGLLASWYRQLWRSHAAQWPEPIGAQALLLLARQCQPEADQFAADAQRASLLEWIESAWQLLHRHQSNGFRLDTVYAEPLTQGQRYAALWLEQLQQALAANGWISAAELPHWLAQALNPTLEPGVKLTAQLNLPTTLHLVGFEQLEPALAGLWQQLEANGINIINVAPDLTPTAQSGQVNAESSAAEFSMVAAWCRDLLEQDQQNPTNLRIGVVHPNLVSVREQLERALATELQPLQPSHSTDLFAVGAGRPLGQEPMCRSAIEFLTWCLTPRTADQVTAVLSSPFLADLPLQTLSPRLPRTFSLRQFARQMASTVAPVFTQLAMAIQQLPDNAELPIWQQQFTQLLHIAGWGGGSPGTVAFQALNQTRALLQTPILYSRDESAGSMSAPAALACIEDTFAREMFAPQSQDTPILALGSLETTGLSFSHLWVMGMQDITWPAPVQTNPLIPFGAQQALGIPRLDSTAELAFARSRITHWRASTDTLVFSYAEQDQETQCEISALLRDEPTPSWFLQHDSRPPQQNLQPISLECVVDDHLHLPAVTDISVQTIRGGTGLLSDQAMCPFRAFAKHRLQLAPAPEPHSYPNPMEQGTLVHAALQTYGERYLLKLHAHQPSPGELAELAASTIQTELGRFPAAIRELEQTRLTRLLSEFQSFELRRGADAESVLQETRSEQAIDLTLGTNRYQFRVDRIDQYPQGRRVIDYKTGSIRISRLFEDRLSEPQLAAYACVIDDVVQVELYQVTADAIKSQTLGGSDLGLAKETKTNKLNEAEFRDLKAHWRLQLETLNTEFSNGVASVTPLKEACTYCHLASLCRIEHLGLTTQANGPWLEASAGRGDSEQTIEDY